MWFNSTQREEPYQALTSRLRESETTLVSSAGSVTGAAWLSSARVVRCWVKSRNERNPFCQLPTGNAGNSDDTAGDKPEEGGDDVKSSWPLRPGLHTYYNGGDNEQLGSDTVQISKSHLSSDCSLQLEHEVGIASNRGSACHGEYVPGSCTHRPSSDGNWFYPKAGR